MVYMLGDVQGCGDALERMLAELGFSASRDTLYVLGDLVNRGPTSLATLQRLRGLGPSAVCLLGNHDWHLLAVAHGVRRLHDGDTLGEILAAPDRDEWIEWLRHRRMAVHAHGWLMVHAGVVPQWDLALTLDLAAELERHLSTDALPELLHGLFGNEPRLWRDDLAASERLRFALNVLTRIRFVDEDGALELKLKESAGAAPAGLHAWFDAPNRRTAGVPVAFGHWSTLGFVSRPDLLSLDTGCVWGGRLTAVRIDGGRRDACHVECAQARRPG